METSEFTNNIALHILYISTGNDVIFFLSAANRILLLIFGHDFSVTVQQILKKFSLQRAIRHLTFLRLHTFSQQAIASMIANDGRSWIIVVLFRTVPPNGGLSCCLDFFSRQTLM